MEIFGKLPIIGHPGVEWLLGKRQRSGIQEVPTMTHFGPTRAEMKFRFSVSIFGLLMIIAGVAMRGLPLTQAQLSMLFLASLFLGASAAFSFVKLTRMDED